MSDRTSRSVLEVGFGNGTCCSLIYEKGMDAQSKVVSWLHWEGGPLATTGLSSGVDRIG